MDERDAENAGAIVGEIIATTYCFAMMTGKSPRSLDRVFRHVVEDRVGGAGRLVANTLEARPEATKLSRPHLNVIDFPLAIRGLVQT